MAKPASPQRDARDVVPPATTSLSPRGGALHRTLKPSIIEALRVAGAEGMTVAELAEQLGVLKTRVQAWFSSTGKHLDEIEKIGVARWRFSRSKPSGGRTSR